MPKRVMITKWQEVRVLSEHGWTCALCTRVISPTANRHHPSGLQIDHVIPVERGGTGDDDNLRPTHASCNMRKHSHPDTTQAEYSDRYDKLYEKWTKVHYFD